MLKIKKIYVDSRWKTDDSISHTEFKYDLGNTYDMPINTCVYIDDVNIPNSWYSIEWDVNNRMHLAWIEPATNTQIFSIIPLPSKIYNGDDFVIALNLLLDTLTVSQVNNLPVKHFKATYDPTNSLLNISSTNCPYFKILSDDGLKISGASWSGPSSECNSKDLRSLNEVIKQYGTQHQLLVPLMNLFQDSWIFHITTTFTYHQILGLTKH